MPLVADHDDLETLGAHLRHFDVHLGHQRAGRIEHAQPARLGCLADGARHAVRAEDDRAAHRHVVQLLHEHRTLAAQIAHHVGVVHDLVAHIDGRTEPLQRALDDLDRAIHAGAEAARLRQQDFGVGLGHGFDGGVHGCVHHRIPISWTSNRMVCPASGWLKSNSAAVSPISFSTPAYLPPLGALNSTRSPGW